MSSPVLIFIIVTMTVMYNLRQKAEEIRFECEWNIQVDRDTEFLIIKQISKDGCIFNVSAAKSNSYVLDKVVKDFGYSLRNWKLITPAS
jgi:hypothetical protein